MSRRALIIVDVQNDFCEGGALAVAGGRAVARAIAQYVAAHESEYKTIIMSQDWHAPEGSNGGHFAARPDYLDTWPAHCVADTPGAEIVGALQQTVMDACVRKGWRKPAYSVFEGTSTLSRQSTSEILTEAGITDIDVCGLALDHCVKATALDAIKNGYGARVLTSLTAAVSRETTMSATRAMADAGVQIP